MKHIEGHATNCPCPGCLALRAAGHGERQETRQRTIDTASAIMDCAIFADTMTRRAGDQDEPLHITAAETARLQKSAHIAKAHAGELERNA